MIEHLQATMADLVDATLALTESSLLESPFDPDWRSPCEIHQSDQSTYWKPVRQSPVMDFRGLAHALEEEIHPDIITWYTSYWSGTLETDSEEGRVSLIQLWNENDFERLIANLIGHAIAKRKKKQPFTVFFANTEPESQYFLSIDNKSGAVLLEEPGKPPQQTVEDSLATFLKRLHPCIRQPELY